MDRRFDLVVTATGPFIPNGAIHLTARATARFATKGATISIRLPEVHFARASGGVFDTLPSDTRVPAFAQTHAALAASGVVEATATAVIAKSGLYSVVATVVADSAEPGMLNGRYVQNVSHQVIWLLIDERGGRILSQYDSSVIPPGMNDDHLGAWRKKNSSNPSKTVQPATFYMNVQLLYFNNDHGAAEVLAGISYQVFSGSTLVSSGNTDQSGSFVIACTSGQYQIKATARVPGEANEQDYHGNIWQLFNYTTATNPCSPVPKLQLFTMLSDQSMVITQARITVDSSRAFFQVSRGEVVFEFNRDQGDNNTDYYDSGDDHINLYYNSIYHDYGRFSISHEYGHALAQTSLGGTRGGYCPSPHYLDSLYNLQCALSEGWADYHSVAIRGADDGIFYTSIAANSYYHGGDGSIVEGAVAAFLFDVSARSGISDPFNGYDLALHYPGNFVAHMLDQCVMTPALLPSRSPNGVDDMTYCLEDLLDPTIESTYFLTRSTYDRPASGGYTVGPSFPSNWSQPDVRRVWLHKLYGQ